MVVRRAGGGVALLAVGLGCHSLVLALQEEVAVRRPLPVFQHGLQRRPSTVVETGSKTEAAVDKDWQIRVRLFDEGGLQNATTSPVERTSAATEGSTLLYVEVADGWLQPSLLSGTARQRNPSVTSSRFSGGRRKGSLHWLRPGRGGTAL